MTDLDSLGRSSGAAIRAAAAADVGSPGGLPDVHRRATARRRRETAAVLVATAVVVASSAVALRSITATAPVVGDGVVHRVPWDQCTRSAPNPCQDLASGKYRVQLQVPFVVSVPSGW